MKPKIEHDPEFCGLPARKSIGRRVSLVVLMIALVAVLTLYFAGPVPSQPVRWQGIPMRNVAYQPIRQTAPVVPFSPGSRAARQPFVVMAPTTDMEMVHPAPEGIDEAMVIRAEGERLAARVVLAPPLDLDGR